MPIANHLSSDLDQIVEAVEALIRLIPARRVDREDGDEFILVTVADYVFESPDVEGRRAQVHALRLFRGWFGRFTVFLKDLPDHEANELQRVAAQLSKSWIEHADNCWGLQASPAASIKAFLEDVRPIRFAIEPFLVAEDPVDAVRPSPSMRRFRVALSFAGERRDFVDPLARILARTFTEAGVLYDRFHEAEFARPDLGIYLPKLYNEEADLIVVVACPNYDQKEWTGLEWSAIHDLIQQRRYGKVMLCRFGQATVSGLFRGAGWVELDDRSPGEAAELIRRRLALNPACQEG